MRADMLKRHVDSGTLRIRQKDTERIRSMMDSSEMNAKVILSLKLDDTTATIIFREIYESIRQLGDAKLGLLGFEPMNHEISMDILKEFDIKEKVKLFSLDRFRKIRHDINYRGFRASTAQAEEIREFWTRCGMEILKILRKEL